MNLEEIYHSETLKMAAELMDIRLVRHYASYNALLKLLESKNLTSVKNVNKILGIKKGKQLLSGKVEKFSPEEISGYTATVIVEFLPESLVRRHAEENE